MIDGNTRLFAILGDPIGQVRAPTALNAIFAARGLNAVLVPIEVPPAGFDAVMAGFKAATNLTPTEFRRLAMAGNAAPGNDRLKIGQSG